MDSTIKTALANLDLPQYESVRAVFGTVLKRRSAAVDPRCAWWQMLAGHLKIMKKINADCLRYVSLVGHTGAQLKCEADLLGPARHSPYKNFQGCLSDFYSEVSAVTELSKVGYRNFAALVAQGMHDYSAEFEGEMACVEVKHARAPITVTDIFFSKFQQLRTTRSEEYPFRLRIEHYVDDTATEKQIHEIGLYLDSLAGRKAPFEDKLLLTGGSEARIAADPGPGSPVGIRSRSVGPEDPVKFNVEGLFNKIRSETRKAMGQMTGKSCIKVLVIDITTPGAEIAYEHLRTARQVIIEESTGTLQPYLLHYGNLISSDVFE